MKFSLQCPVESMMRLPTTVNVDWFGRALRFFSNDAGFLSEVRITTAVPDSEASEVRTEAVLDDEGKTVHLNIGIALSWQEEMIGDLQTIESVLAYYFNVRRIKWREVTAEIERENPDEEERVKIHKWTITPRVTPVPTDFDLEKLRRVLFRAENCRDLTASLAFYREGQNNLQDMRYINAFFDFYFVLEGLYGSGKTKNADVEREFKRSANLRGAVEDAAAAGFPQPLRLDRPTVQSFLDRVNKKPDPEGIVHMLVWCRGDLHHFVSSHKVRKGSPITDDDYECLARFAYEICKRALFAEIRDRTPVMPLPSPLAG